MGGKEDTRHAVYCVQCILQKHSFAIVQVKLEERREYSMRKKNKGSAVIETTLLIPVFLGCIYFYIMLFLFFVDSGKRMEQIAASMYKVQTAQNGNSEEWEEDILIRTEGKMKIYRIEEEDGLFDIQLELRKDQNNAVENIRRWQLVTGLF